MSKSKNKDLPFCLVLSLGLFLLANLFVQAAIQETGQGQEKKKLPPIQQTIGGTMGGVVSGVVGTAQGGVIGGITSKTFDDDFLLEPRKIVTFVVEHLLVKPTETVALPGKTNLRTELGMSVSYSLRWPEPAKSEAGLEITPTIFEDKGLNLRISVLKNGQVIKDETVLASNLESVVVELFKDETNGMKFAEKITPFIQTIEPLQSYPRPIDKLEIVNDVLIINDVMVVNRSRGGILISDDGSEASPFYLYFWIRGKGVYVLSLWPFPGSKPLGVISDSVIRIRQGRDYFAWYSLRPLLPEGKWRIWVRNNPDYDPLKEMYSSLNEKDRERVSSILGKENAALTGVAGKNTLEKFFKSK
jgi:hypothetical protein